MVKKNQLGNIIRINRLSQNMSVRSLAESVGIEFSQLSKIERGIESSNEFVLEAIFEALDIHYQELLSFLDYSNQETKTLYRDIIYRKPLSDIEEKITALNKRSSTIAYDLDIMLVNLFFSLVYDHVIINQEKILNLLNKIIDTVTLEHKQLIYYLNGLYAKQQQQYNKALEYYCLADAIYIDQPIQSMILYHKGLIYKSIGDLFEAYDYLCQSKRLFENNHNYIRSALCSQSIADIFLLTGKYQKAQTMYKDLLPIYHQLGLSFQDQLPVYLHQAIILVLTCQYADFFDWIESLPKEIKILLEQSTHYQAYHLAALYHSHQFEQCQIIINQYKDMTQNRLDRCLIDYYELCLKHADDKQFSSKLTEHLNQIEKKGYYNEDRLALKLLIKEYESSKNFELLYRYSMVLSNIKI